MVEYVKLSMMVALTQFGQKPVVGQCFQMKNSKGTIVYILEEHEENVFSYKLVNKNNWTIVGKTTFKERLDW